MSRSKPKPMSPPASGVRAGGFTLVELGVTLAVLAILVTIAAPNFQGMINHNRLVSGTNEFVAALQVAKSEAIRRNARVTLCPTTNGTSCSGSDWSRTVMRTSDNAVLREVAINSRLTVRASSNVGTSIVFRPDGLARQGSSVGTILSGKIEVCTNTTRPTQNARHVAVSGARVSVDPPLTSASCAGQVGNS
ncbi:GspH/FimT family pseudopilin [Marilutibacter alkalisoli]|uniref:Type II secretion system protein H n=1 Tax=Marilutibacter alkalisoli TaxID=2591633 RepID=A0A514BQZ7_9GAMM|nr:GspH/FimT family pseudopilin [Lysobacter alkalisoli]QDH69429.1 prepilin-type N-terminal cleavage/methylation domain-containing protein [Lysobacter alkalisoli]